MKMAYVLLMVRVQASPERDITSTSSRASVFVGGMRKDTHEKMTSVVELMKRVAVMWLIHGSTGVGSPASLLSSFTFLHNAGAVCPGFVIVTSRKIKENFIQVAVRLTGNMKLPFWRTNHD